MNGIRATLNELKNSIQPAISTGKFGGKVWGKAQLDETDNISDIEAGKFFVVRNIEEYTLRVRQRRHACVSFPVR